MMEAIYDTIARLREIAYPRTWHSFERDDWECGPVPIVETVENGSGVAAIDAWLWAGRWSCEPGVLGTSGYARGSGSVVTAWVGEHDASEVCLP